MKYYHVKFPFTRCILGIIFLCFMGNSVNRSEACSERDEIVLRAPLGEKYTLKRWNSSSHIHPNKHNAPIIIVPKSLTFSDSTGRYVHYIWDMFIVEKIIVVIFSRLLPIPLEKVSFFIPNIDEELFCFEKFHSVDVNWLANHPNGVIVAFFGSGKLTNFLSSKIPSSTISAHLKIYNLCEFVNLPIQKQFSANVNETKITAVTMIGEDITFKEMRTWIHYHSLIGVTKYYFYYLIPIPISHIAEFTQLLSEKNHLEIVIFQWYPLYVFHPRLSSPRKGSSEIALIQSALYREKELSDYHRRHRSYLTHIDIDEYLVVHPNYHNLQEMLEAMMFNGKFEYGGMEFPNCYFTLRSLQEKELLPRGFSFEEFLSSEMIRESDLSIFNYRPKLIINIYHVLLIGGHQIIAIQETTPLKLRNSGTFYLHYLKSSPFHSDRNISLLQKPIKSSLKMLLTLPRYNEDRDSFSNETIVEKNYHYYSTRNFFAKLKEFEGGG